MPKKLTNIMICTAALTKFHQIVSRNRLSYEQFSEFLSSIKELNAHRQTREVISSIIICNPPILCQVLHKSLENPYSVLGTLGA